jgi:hypothetical protein
LLSSLYEVKVIGFEAVPLATIVTLPDRVISGPLLQPDSFSQERIVTTAIKKSAKYRSFITGWFYVFWLSLSFSQQVNFTETNLLGVLTIYVKTSEDP